MKKIVSVMAIITCVFGLTACGGTEVNTVEGTAISDASMESYVISYGESLVSSIDSIVRQGASSLYDDDEVLSGALEDYENSISDIGTISGYDNEQAVIDDDGDYLINIGIVGSEHSADIVITVDSDEGTLASVSTNVRYSSGELLQQAGLNTLLGMGTTFVVLIILALLIYCFKYIGIFQDKQAKKQALKAEAEKPAAPAPAPAPAAEVVYEEEVDDSELIAVITAAVAAYEEEASGAAVKSASQLKTDGYVVRSIRKSRRKY